MRPRCKFAVARAAHLAPQAAAEMRDALEALQAEHGAAEEALRQEVSAALDAKQVGARSVEGNGGGGCCWG